MKPWNISLRKRKEYFKILYKETNQPVVPLGFLKGVANCPLSGGGLLGGADASPP
jgi:hypothetical protein